MQVRSQSSARQHIKGSFRVKTNGNSISTSKTQPIALAKLMVWSGKSEGLAE